MRKAITASTEPFTVGDKHLRTLPGWLCWLKFARGLWPVWLAPLLLLGPDLVRGRVLFWGTPSLQFVPWWWQIWQQVSSGHWPLWNPFNGMGAPLLANYQSAFFYPPSWLLLPLAELWGPGGIAWGFGLLAMLHLIWGGLGMSTLLRRLGFGWMAQVIGGLSYGLSGAIVGRMGFLSMIWSAAWLPWVLFFASQLGYPGQTRSDNQRIPGLAFNLNSIPLGLTAVLAMQLLAGHAQFTWYTLLLAAAWVLWGAWWAGGLRSAARSMAAFGAAGLLAALIAAVQLGPTMQYLQSSQRADAVAITDAMRYSFWPWRFISLFSPDFFGNPGMGDFWGYATYWEDHAYPGMLVMILALASLVLLVKGLWRRRRSPRWGLVTFGWLLLTVTFVLALGNNTAVFPFLYHHVPTFDMFQAPARYLLWAAFGLPLLAAAASEHWRTPTGRGLYWLRLGTAGAFAVTLGALLAWLLLHDVRLTFVRAAAITGIWGLGVGLLTLSMTWAAAKEGRQRAWRGLAALWLLLDLLLVSVPLNPTVDIGFYGLQNNPQTGLPALANDGRVYVDPITEYDLKFHRFLRFTDDRPMESWDGMRAALLPNLNLLEPIASANNFDPLVSGRYARWMSALAEAGPHEKDAMLRLMNVTAVEQIDVRQPTGVRYDPLPTGAPSGSVNGYACVLAVASESRAWQATQAQMQQKEGGPADHWLVIEQGGAGEGAVACSAAQSIRADEVTRSAGRITLHAAADADGWLLLSESYDAGWRASIDGSPVALYPAYTAFMAVAVPSGNHQIVFTYRPDGFIFGGLLSILGLIGSLFLWYLRRAANGGEKGIVQQQLLDSDC